MELNEIKSFLLNSSRSSICVHRRVLEGTETIVFSIYLSGNPNSCSINFEFDPISMVDQGEGWLWQSIPTKLEDNTKLLETYLNKPMSDWVNYSSALSPFEDIELDVKKYTEDENYYKNTLKFGLTVLPQSVAWSKEPT